MIRVRRASTAKARITEVTVGQGVTAGLSVSHINTGKARGSQPVRNSAILDSSSETTKATCAEVISSARLVAFLGRKRLKRIARLASLGLNFVDSSSKKGTLP